MEPVHGLGSGVLAATLQRQPLTPAKLKFCWRLVVGKAIDRATRVRLADNGELVVDVADAHWKREVERVLPLILAGLAPLLGPGVVRRATVRRRGR